MFRIIFCALVILTFPFLSFALSLTGLSDFIITHTHKGQKITQQQVGTPEQIQIWLKTAWLLRWYVLLILIGTSLLIRLLTTSTFAESQDSLYFVRGVERYNVLEQRPHWPGYPVYIWLGKLLAWFIPNSNQALHTLSVLASSLTILPVVALTYSWRLAAKASPKQAWLSGITAGFIWLLIPLAWINGGEIYSDPLALLVGFSMLWLCYRALQAQARADRWVVGAAVLAGLLVGVRLAYFPLLSVLFYTLWFTRKTPFSFSLGKRNYTYYLLPFFGLAYLIASCAIWFSWQWTVEGVGYLEAAKIHLSGHYEVWGNTIATDPNPAARPLRAAEVLLSYSLGSWWPGATWPRILVSLLLAYLVSLGVYRLTRTPKVSGWGLALVWGVPYLGVMLTNYDINLDRYHFPLALLVCCIAGLGLPKPDFLAKLTLSLTVAVLFSVSAPLAVNHHNEPPLGYKLSQYLLTNLNPARTIIVVTDANPVLPHYLNEFTPRHQIFYPTPAELATYTRQLSRQGYPIYAVMTLAETEAEKNNQWQPIARWCRPAYVGSRAPYETHLYLYVGNRSQATRLPVLITSLPCS